MPQQSEPKADPRNARKDNARKDEPKDGPPA
jgi:hypothetical protein